MNLLFCTTPLQALIAEQIMRQYPGEAFYCVFRGSKAQPKQLHYYERLRLKCLDGCFIEPIPADSGPKDFIGIASRLWLGYKLRHCRRVFVASPEVLDFWLLMPGLSKAEVYTYDDGLANLSEAAWATYHRNSYPNYFLIALARLLGIPDTQMIIARSQKHYTIFPYPNVFPNTELLELYPREESTIEDKTSKIASKKLRLFCGQSVYDERDKQANKAITEQVIRDYAIEAYLPHPREEYTVEGVEYIRTPLIAEDYLLGLLREQPDLQVELYSYCSTALLNLSAVPRIRVHAIKPEGSMPLLDETFALYQSLGIPMDNISLR